MRALHDSTVVFSLLATFCALIFWSERQPFARSFYRFVPPIVLVCYLPAIASAFGVLPYRSAVYQWMGDYLLPLSLFLLMITADLGSILRVGRAASALTLIGTAGVILGAPLAYLICRPWLPPDAWTAMAAIAGGWIGGPVNFAAIVNAVGVPERLVGPALIVDTAIAFSWLSVLLLLARHQWAINRFLGADAGRLAAADTAAPGQVPATRARTPEVADVLIITAVGLGGVIVCEPAAEFLAASMSPLMNRAVPHLGDLFSSYMWLIMLVTTLGIALSLTPVRRIEHTGAPAFAYVALYLFLASLGAQADLSGISAMPALLTAGVLWMLVHIVFVLAGARLLGAPLALAAIGSMANIGGTVSTPVLAAAYARSLVPAGLLLAVFCNIIGTYGALLCAYLLQMVAAQ